MRDDIATLWRAELDSTVGTPLQRQLYDQIRNGILQSDLPGGSRLPSSRALAARLGVARVTVVQCYEQLVAEGYLETKSGAGTFVSAAGPDTLVSMRPSSTSPGPVRQKPAQQPLLSGMPALDQFPKAKWARIAGRTSRALDHSIMYHSDTMGFEPMRENIAQYLRASRSVVCDASQIMMISGLQQGLYLLATAALETGKSIIMEDPGYDGMLAAARASGQKVDYTGVDAEGAIVPDKLSGMLVTSPSRQYPLGYTMSLGRRLEMLSWARATNSLIFEDDYDSEFRYAGRPLNSLQGIDGGERVIYGGTFSKSIFPAIRLGYLVLPHHLVEPVRTMRAAIDSFPSIHNQHVLNAFMEDGEFTRHIRRLRKIHARRKEAFEKYANSFLGTWLEFQSSDAGLHLLALSREPLLASKLKDKQLAEMAQQAGIGAVPLSQTFQAAQPKQGLLVGFANLSETDVKSGVERLAALIRAETGFSSQGQRCSLESSKT